MSDKITRREVLKGVTAAAAAFVLMPPVVAAPQPLIPLPAPSTFPGCILIRDHRGRNRWQLAGRNVANEEEKR